MNLMTHEYGIVSVDQTQIVRLSSPGLARETLVFMANGNSFIASEMPGEILQRAALGDAHFLEVIPVEDGFERIHPNWIALLTKPNEDYRQDPDPTRIHLVDGCLVLVEESIRTITARLAGCGFEMLDIDVVATERPAALYPTSVRGAVPTDDRNQLALTLAGGIEISVNDQSGNVFRRVIMDEGLFPPLDQVESDQEADRFQSK